MPLDRHKLSPSCLVSQPSYMATRSCLLGHAPYDSYMYRLHVTRMKLQVAHHLKDGGEVGENDVSLTYRAQDYGCHIIATLYLRTTTIASDRVALTRRLPPCTGSVPSKKENSALPATLTY